MSKHLKKLANRAQDDGFFLACLLKLYATSENLDDAKLAAKLGCPPDVLTPLRSAALPGFCPWNSKRTLSKLPSGSP